MEEGRILNNAPYGFINSRDDHGKTILVVQKEKAEVVREIFQQVIAGASLKDSSTETPSEPISVSHRDPSKTPNYPRELPSTPAAEWRYAT
jgi:hypothetical protein